jgi:preprotein translocase subunit SecG
MGILTALHVLICVSLVSIILMQRGRGGGLVDSFSNLETVFGTKTSAFLTKLTTVLAISFVVTCLLLAFLSLQQSKSLIRNVPVMPAAHNATSGQNATSTTPAAAPAASTSTPAASTAPAAPIAPVTPVTPGQNATQ